MMVAGCERLHAFADGELPADESLPFERHFLRCPGCQAELADVMCLEALGQRRRPRPTPLELPVLEAAPGGSGRLGPRPENTRRSALWIGGVIALTAGVLLLEWLRERRSAVAQSFQDLSAL